MAAVLALPAFWSAVGAGAAAGGAIGAAKISSNAAENAANAQVGALRYGADAQSKATEEALNFQRQQAETQWQNEEAARKATYDQWKAREDRISSILGGRFGLGQRTVPPYVPGVDPHYDTGATPLPGQSSTTSSPSGTGGGFTSGTGSKTDPSTGSSSGTGTSGTSGTSGTGSIKFGGGWDTTSDPIAKAVQQGLAKGLSGQGLVDSINSQFNLKPGSSLAYYPNTGQYAMPNWYAAPNSSGALDLITRGASSTSSPTRPSSLFASPTSMFSSPSGSFGSLMATPTIAPALALPMPGVGMPDPYTPGTAGTFGSYLGGY